MDVLKKKMRQTKEEMERYKEESEDMARKLQVEISRREEVSVVRRGWVRLVSSRQLLLLYLTPHPPIFCNNLMIVSHVM